MKKKLLIVTEHFYPSTKGGGPVVSINNLVDELKQDYSIYVLTYSSDLNSNKPYKNINENSWNKVFGVNVYYLRKTSLSRNVMRDLVNEVNPDSIYLNSFFSKLSIYIFSTISNKKIILSPRGEFNSSALSIKRLKKVVYLTFFNIMYKRKVHIWYATSEQEEKDILKMMKNVRTVMIPNLTSKIKVKTKNDKRSRNTNLIFLSRIVEMKNLLYALKILSHIDITDRKINFDIYGPIEDKEYWIECKKLISNLPDNINVMYKGQVKNTEVPEVMSNYDFLLLPTKGENFGHVIFEAMSSGCVPIISDQTPWKNLKQKGFGWDISLANEELFAEAVTEAIDLDSETYGKMLEKLKIFIDEYNNNDDVSKKICELFS